MTGPRRSQGSTVKRRAAYGRGRRGEWLAVLLLLCKGYRVIARDLRLPVGEIDIVARRGRTIAIVEVKRRDSLEQAAESISPRQRGRIAQAARWFASQRPALAGHDIRYDAILIAPGRWPRHIADAWREDDSHG
jgi:putative endonuclease